MSRAIAVLRPEPGNRVTAAAIEARGRAAMRLPLFEARPVAWNAPEVERFDALILTSANAVRHGGAGLTALLGLPVYAVGEVTAEAARRVGFEVAGVGDDGAAALMAMAEAAGVCRALHLAGRERTLDSGGIIVDIITVYASESLAPQGLERIAGSVVLVQSTRAGARLAEVVDADGIDRADIALVAISDTAGAAAGSGWERILVPDSPHSEALIDAAIALAD